jgi:DNA-binding NtrC family response regulator
MKVSKKNILVVDDQENWRKVLTHLLEQDGYTVKTTEGFRGASEEIKKGQVDLVVLDVRLVDEETYNVQGLELLKLARAQTPMLPAIILTGYPDVIREETLGDLLKDSLFLKVPPGKMFDSSAFLEKVRNIVQEADSNGS